MLIMAVFVFCHRQVKSGVLRDGKNQGYADLIKIRTGGGSLDFQPGKAYLWRKKPEVALHTERIECHR
jgi:hypothetical protein